MKPAGYLRKALKYFISLTWRKIYWPDGAMLFMKSSLKSVLALHKKYHFSHVISVGLPFSCHLVARHLKQQDDNIYWLMDIEDPFSYSKEFRVNNFSRYYRKNILEEERAFDLADDITLTNKNALDRYAELFPFCQNKLHVIPPLFSKPESEQAIKYDFERDKIHLAYFGSFYENVRSPESFLNFINMMKDIYPDFISKCRFHFFGDHSRFSLDLFHRYSHLRKQIKIQGFLSPPQMHHVVRQMHVLLNFGNLTDYHLPSKILDFAYFRKAVIHFTYKAEDPAVSFLKAFNLEELVIPADRQLDIELMNTFRSFVEKNASLHNSFSTEGLNKFMPSSIGKQYEKLLNSFN